MWNADAASKAHRSDVSQSVYAAEVEAIVVSPLDPDWHPDGGADSGAAAAAEPFFSTAAPVTPAPAMPMPAASAPMPPAPMPAAPTSPPAVAPAAPVAAPPAPVAMPTVP